MDISREIRRVCCFTADIGIPLGRSSNADNFKTLTEGEISSILASLLVFHLITLSARASTLGGIPQHREVEVGRVRRLFIASSFKNSSAAIPHRTLGVILIGRNAHVCSKIVTRTITNITCNASGSESKKQYGNQLFHFLLALISPQTPTAPYSLARRSISSFTFISWVAANFRWLESKRSRPIQ